jgi:iron complex outermembrane receptor protein
MMDKIEVIRSNASAIWGNAAGGVVSMTSMPFISKPFVRAGFMGGSFGFRKATAEAGSKLGEGSIYTAFSGTKYDGYRDNSNGERYLGNIGINSPLGPATNLGVHIMAVSNKFYIPGPLTLAQYEVTPDQANPDYLKQKEFRHNRSGRIGITLDHNFDDNNGISSMLFVNPKYLLRSERNTYRYFDRYHTGGNLSYKNNMNFSPELRNTLIAGMDESYQDGAIQFYYLTNTKQDTLKSSKKEGANSFGAYLQDEIRWNENVSLVLGVRYDKITYYNQVFFDGGENVKDAKETKEFSKVIPKVAISYLFTADHSIYFSYGGGVEVPAGNETDPADDQPGIYLVNPLLEPIVSQTVELGDKFAFNFDDSFVRRMNQEAAVYMINTTNDIIPYKGGTFYFSAGETRRTGFEYGLGFDFEYGISLDAAVTYANNKYVNYTIDSSHIGGGSSKTVLDYKDNKIAGLPDLYYNASLRWQSTSLWNLYAELNLQGVGAYFADDANKYEVPSYYIINLNFGLARPIIIAGGLGIKAYASINNIADVKYVGSAFINPDMDKTTKLPKYLESGLPRNIMLGFNLSWN